MGDALTWAALIGAGTSVTAIVTFWMTVGARIAAAEAKADSAKALAEAILAKQELRYTQADDWRSKTGERIAALESVVQAQTTSFVAAETRLAKSIDDLGARFDRMSESILRTLADVARHQKDG